MVKTNVRKHTRRTKRGVTTVRHHNRNLTKLNKLHLKIKHPMEDTDGDGIVNKYDCDPLDPKKQGKLHDLQLKILKKREEMLERKREKEMKKLEDLKDVLKVKTAIASKKATIKQSQLREKQAVINELNRERRKLQEIKNANIKAKQELAKYTITGKVSRGVAKASKTSLRATQAFLNKKSTQKTLKGVSKFLMGK